MFQEIVAGMMARGIPEHIAIGIATRMRAGSWLGIAQLCWGTILQPRSNLSLRGHRAAL